MQWSEQYTKLVMSVEEARRLLGGLSRGLVYEAIRRGEIPSIRIGRRILVPRAALMKMLEGEDARSEAGQQLGG